jgi:transcriptional regulator with XRE-family HTH domain
MGRLWEILQRHIDSAPYPPSERQVALKLGVSPTTLANWREPKKLPTRENLEAIAELAGVRYATVLEAALYDTGYHEGGAGHEQRSPTATKLPPPRPRAEVEEELGHVVDELEHQLPRYARLTQEAARPGLERRRDDLQAELARAVEWERNLPSERRG